MTTPTTEHQDEPTDEAWAADLGVADLGGPTLLEVIDDGDSE